MNDKQTTDKKTAPDKQTAPDKRAAEKSLDNVSPATRERYQRYHSVIQYVSRLAVIELEETKQACQPERPAFVRKVIEALEASGWILREQLRDGTYRWNRGRGEFVAEKWLDDTIFSTQIINTPEQDRPRERLLKHGADQLRTAELLAILIRTGRAGESAVQSGETIANKFQHRMQDLPLNGRGELKEISKAISESAYCQIMAGIELGRRVTAAGTDREQSKILSSSEAIQFCERRFARLIEDAKQEEFHIVTLNTKNGVIDTHQITVGTLDASLVHPREVFRAAIKDHASSVILVHNHPSGDPTPSKEDLAVTKRLEEAGTLIGIDVLDHVVLGSFNSVSIREYRS